MFWGKKFATKKKKKKKKTLVWSTGKNPKKGENKRRQKEIDSLH